MNDRLLGSGEYLLTSQGWDGPPEECEALGTELIYRAYDSGFRAASTLTGRYFFTPRVAGQFVHHMSAAQLEVELNAALWGNRFSRLATLRLVKGARFLIGRIAQGNYTEKDELGRLFQARSFVVPSGIFQQVFVADPARSVVLIDDDLIAGADQFMHRASQHSH